MRKTLVLGAGRGPRLAVLEHLKRSGSGMDVGSLSDALGMSYMGVKAHCIALEAAGYLTTWREPATKGRPRMLYRLAVSGESLFEGSGQDLALGLLSEAAALFGAAAPQKLLVMYFRSLTAHYNREIKGERALEKVKSLVRIRDREGRMRSLVEQETWSIRESHDPLAALMRDYPVAASLEEQMMSEVLGIAVLRREEGGVVTFALKDEKLKN